MEVKVDLRVLELLSSRLCHDLISPIGAVNNGLELLEDEGSGMGDDALKLSIKSARRAADLLQAFRVALGAAGNQASVRLADVRSLAAGLLEGGKTQLDWSAEHDATPMPVGMGKLILNLVMLAGECLPRGGRLAVAVSAGDGRADGRVWARVTASGQGARLAPEMAAALAPGASIDELTPKTVQGYFVARLAEAAEGGLEIAPDGQGRSPGEASESVVLSAFMPADRG